MVKTKDTGAWYQCRLGIAWPRSSMAITQSADTAAPAIDFVGGDSYVDVAQWQEYGGRSIARAIFRERADCGRAEEEVNEVD